MVDFRIVELECTLELYIVNPETSGTGKEDVSAFILNVDKSYIKFQQRTDGSYVVNKGESHVYEPLSKADIKTLFMESEREP